MSSHTRKSRSGGKRRIWSGGRMAGFAVAVVATSGLLALLTGGQPAAHAEDAARAEMQANGMRFMPARNRVGRLENRAQVIDEFARSPLRPLVVLGEQAEGIVLEQGSARKAAEELVSTGASPNHSRVQALEWIDQQGGVVATDPETGGMIVSLQSNPQLVDLTPLVALPEINCLEISTEAALDLSPLVGLPELQRLALTNCPNLCDVTSLAGLTQLRFLGLYYCSCLSDLSGLASLECLEELHVSYASISNLTPLTRLSSLRVLNIYGCQQITDISPLVFLEKLEEAHFISCMGLSDVSALESLPNLQLLVTRFEGC